MSATVIEDEALARHKERNRIALAFAITGIKPAPPKPVVIVQAEMFNRSRLRTVLVAGITTSVSLANAPGNVLLSAPSSGLPKDSVVNVSQLLTLDRKYLVERAGSVSARVMLAVDEGLRLILAL